MNKFINLIRFNHKSICIALILVVFTIINISLVYRTFYIDSSSNIHSTYEGYGDIPLHLTQISKFAFSQNFDLVDPIYYGSNLQYPFLFNFIRGILLSLTNSWTFSVLWPLFLIIIVNTILVYLIYSKILKNNWLAIVSMFTFFLGSGFNWVYSTFFNYNFYSFRLDMNYPLQNIDFAAPIITMINQHTFYFGLFLFLLATYLTIKLFESNELSYILFAILTVCIMPIGHTHSFLAIGILLISFVAIGLIFKEINFSRKIFIIGFVGAIIAIPQMFYLLAGKSVSNFTMFRLGWMVKEGIGAVNFPNGSVHSIFSLSFINFLWINLGLILPVFIFSLVILFVYLRKKLSIKDKNKDIFLISSFALSCFIIFVLVQLVQFQPWDFDDNKLLIYFLFFAAPLMVWALKYSLRNYHKIFVTILILISILITFSGIFDIYHRLKIAKQDLPVVFNGEDIKLADYIRSNIDENVLILTGTSHKNPVDSLAGRKVLLGYGGWLWTRGINYGKRQKEIADFFKSPTRESSLFRDYPIGYILYDESVKVQFGANSASLDKLFDRVYESGEYILYSFSKKADSK